VTGRLVIGVLAALLAAASAVAMSSATYTAHSPNAGNTFATAADWVAPALAISAPAAGALTAVATPTVSGTAGNATGDSTTVVVRLYAGASATGTPAQTLNVTRTATTWTTTVPTALATGAYTVQATQADAAGNTGTSAARSFTVDRTQPSPTMIAAANGGANAGRLNAGDTITYMFSEAISPTTVLSTFTGGATTASVRVLFTNAGTTAAPTDRFTVLDSAGAANVRLDGGSANGVATKANLVTATTVTWPATMSQSADGKSFTIVLGTAPTGLATVTNTQKNMSWTPKAGPTDLAGNALLLPTGTVDEGDSDVDF
jgi:hypothetical protein